jgi:hypothetical protein
MLDTGIPRTQLVASTFSWLPLRIIAAAFFFRAQQSSRWHVLMESPHTAPETSRLQHNVTFLCILAWVVMLFYLSRGYA